MHLDVHPSATQTPTWEDAAQFGPKVAFVGGSFDFSDRMMRLLSAEFVGVRFDRFGDLAAVAALGASQPGLRLLVVDETLFDDLLLLVERDGLSGAEVRPVVAYRDNATARRLLDLRSRFPEFSAIGLLPMDVQVEVLLAAIRLLLCGKCFYPEEIVSMDHGRGGEQPASEPPARPPNADRRILTPREYEVLSLVAEGKQNKVIAEEIGVSEHTVKLHIHNVIAKLGVRNRTAATVWFFESGGAAARLS